MSPWGFIGLLSFFVLLMSCILVMPLRHNRLNLLGIPLIGLAVFLGYCCWGGFGPWRQFLNEEASKERVQQVLSSMKGSQELLARFQSRMKQNPMDAKGWFLLGRLYASQNDNLNAQKSYARAYELAPEHAQFAIHYAYSLWQMNHQRFNSVIRRIFHEVLTKNPNQPDALAMLAMDAYRAHRYAKAIVYWKHLLVLAPEGSEEALSIRKAIVRAERAVTLGA
jgi:cytochrome c-type biogenesis protein CcmH